MSDHDRANTGWHPLDIGRIPGLPDSFSYIPNFITCDEEAGLITDINSRPWVQLSRRRLQVYPAQLTSKSVLIASNPPAEWLTRSIFRKFKDNHLFDDSPHGMANHILVNQYESGQGILPHEDGLAYYPITATVSLGAPAVLDIYEKTADGERRQHPTWRILQEERSLLVTQGEAYGKLLHGIAEVEVDDNLTRETICNWDLLGDQERFSKGAYNRGDRISLTCRDVLKVSSLGSKLLAKK